MTSEYEILRYRPEHKKEVAELQKHLWSPHADLNRSYLEWKYEQNPYLHSPRIYVAMSKGHVVGMRGMLGVKWEAGTPPRTFLGICTEDSVIDPGHRNHRLSMKIMKMVFEDMAAEGHPYLYSLSASPVTIMTSLAMGWKNVGSFQLQCLRSKRAEWYRRIRKRLGEMRFFWRLREFLPGSRWAYRRIPLHQLRDCPSVLQRTGRSHIVIDRSARPEAMSGLVSRMQYDGRIRHVRDREFFSWRYRNPLHRYLFLFWEEDGLEGYLVLQEYVSEFRSQSQVNIVDWEGTSRPVREGLLHAAVQLCPFPDLNLWTATLSEETRNRVREVGFQTVHEGIGIRDIPPSLLVRSLREDLPATDGSLNDRRLLDLANWDLRMVYSMNG